MERKEMSNRDYRDRVKPKRFAEGLGSLANHSLSRGRLCRATQSASALASATVPIASTSTASY